MPTQPERLEGGLLGLLIGDALGVPYEFHPPEARRRYRPCG
jgi:ADP-ribosylglycohydrolase